MTEAQQQYKRELLALMWRWAKESDLTVGQWLEATHEAIERILTPNATPDDDILPDFIDPTEGLE